MNEHVYTVPGTYWNTRYPDCGYTLLGTHRNDLRHCFQLVPGIFTLAENHLRDDCRLLGANANQWRPIKIHNHYITGHGYKRRPGNFYWALFIHMWFSLLWKFYWAGARAHEYTKMRTVSLRDVNNSNRMPLSATSV